MSGSAVKSHDWPKLGKTLSARQTISFLLSFQGGSSSSPTSPPQESLRPEADQASGNRGASSSSSGPVFERNDDHVHAFLRTQIRNILRRWYQNRGSTVFILTSQKTETAKSACERKWQGLFAQDALAKLYFGQKSLVTWWQRITKSSTRKVNRETITGTLSLYKILPLNGFNPIRVKQRLHKRRKKAH